MPRPPEQTAALFAAYKFLERELDKDGDLPAGFYKDLTGQSVSLTFPKGTVVERDKGTHGNGLMLKKAVQNLYGYATWALLIHRLMRFNQWAAIERVILETLTEVVKRPTKNFKEEIAKEYPHVAVEMARLQAELPIPARNESTPRICKDPGLPATITIKMK